jgi:hypothetical protein
MTARRLAAILEPEEEGEGATVNALRKTVDRAGNYRSSAWWLSGMAIPIRSGKLAKAYRL